MKSHFKVMGTFDIGGGLQTASVEIDRTSGIVSVRPFRRRRAYSLPLAAVAAWICQSILRAEVRERRSVGRGRRRARSP